MIPASKREVSVDFDKVALVNPTMTEHKRKDLNCQMTCFGAQALIRWKWGFWEKCK